MRMLSRFIDWRRELLLVTVATMDICWLYPWLAFFLFLAAGPEYVISITGMWLWLLLAVYVVRVLNSFEMSLLKQQFVTIGIALLAILLVIKWELYEAYGLLSPRWIGQLLKDILSVWLAIPPQILILLVGLFVWWRGLRLGQGGLGFGAVGTHFRVGVVGFMIYLIIATFGIPSTYISLLLSFFYFGLIAIALARIVDLHQSRGGIRAPFTSSWLGILVASVAIVIGLGLLASSIFSLEHVQSFFRSLRPITEPVGKVLVNIIIFLLYLLFLLIAVVVRWLQRLIGQPQPVEIELPQLGELKDFQEEFDLARWLGWIKLGRDVLLVALILLAILAVFFAVRRELRRRAEGRDVLRESVWSSEDFMDELAALLRGGWQRLRDGAAAGLGRLLGERYLLTSIRRIYASLNVLAAERGFPRVEAQTPYEYVRVLHEAWPLHPDDIRLLTDAYVQAHYGERKDTDEALQRAREAWERLRAAQPVAKEPEPPAAPDVS